MFNQWLGKQLSNPRGILAKWIGSYMEKGNKKAYKAVVWRSYS